MGVFGHGGLLSKAAHGTKKAGKTVIDAGKAALLNTTHGVGNMLEAGYNLATGDLKGAQKDFAKATGQLTEGFLASETLVNPGAMALNMASGGGVNKVNAIGGELSSMAVNYATGNFNAGSQNLENITGWDIDNSIAEDRERAAQAAYQAEVDAANAAAERNRRANLLSLRKSLTPSLSRSSQGGAAASSMTKSQGGIILG